MIKKITAVLICAAITVAAFAGCALNRPKTFREAAEAGREFAESEGLKDVVFSAESDGAKTTFEGKYDKTAGLGVFSVSYENDDTIHTFKDIIKISGGKLYIRIPDLSGIVSLADLSGVTGFFLPEEYYDFDRSDDDYYFEYDTDPQVPDFSAIFNMTDEELAEYGITRDTLDALAPYLSGEDGFDLGQIITEILPQLDLSGFKLPDDFDYSIFYDLDKYGIDLSGLDLSDLLGVDLSDYIDDDDYFDDSREGGAFSLFNFDSIVGKYIKFDLPAVSAETTDKIVNDATEKAYGSIQDLEPEENYPYVITMTGDDVKELIISVLDAVKTNEDAVTAEITAALKGYIGEDNVKEIEETFEGVSLENFVREAFDSFFAEVTPDMIRSGDTDIACTSKIDYKYGEKYERFDEFTVKEGDQTKNVKTVCIITAAEADESFESRCGVAQTDVLDVKTLTGEDQPE